MPNLSFDFDKLLFVGPLTDRRITKYIKDGYYGKDEQEKLLARDNKRNVAHKERQKDTKPSRKQLLALY